MTSILPQIEALQEIPLFHRAYAAALLRHIVGKINETEDYEIGTFRDGNEYGSELAFDTDDFENSRIELRYNHREFVLIAVDNLDDLMGSIFRYKISEDSDLYQLIPDNLVLQMVQVAEADQDEFG